MLFELPIHPQLVHFPVALFIMAFLIELFGTLLRWPSLQTLAGQLYILGAVMTIPAVVTGYLEAQRLALNHPVLTAHRTYAYWTAGVSLSSLIALGFVHKKFPQYDRPVLRLFLIIVVILVILTGHEGGEMVYEYGVGIQP